MSDLPSVRENRVHKLAVTFVAFLAVGAAHGQQDAGGSVVIRRLLIETLSGECATAHPDLAPKLKAEREQWLATNAEELGRADSRFAALPGDKREALGLALDTARQQARALFATAPNSSQSRQLCSEIVATFGTANESGRMDASTYGEAKGMFRMLMLTEQEAAPECSRRLPALAPSIASAQKTWRERDGRVIATIESAIHASAGDPSLAQLDAQGKRSARSIIDSAFQTGTGEQYCRTFFDDLATGANRARTPKMYAFLENGPNAD